MDILPQGKKLEFADFQKYNVKVDVAISFPSQPEPLQDDLVFILDTLELPIPAKAWEDKEGSTRFTSTKPLVITVTPASLPSLVNSSLQLKVKGTTEDIAKVGVLPYLSSLVSSVLLDRFTVTLTCDVPLMQPDILSSYVMCSITIKAIRNLPKDDLQTFLIPKGYSTTLITPLPYTRTILLTNALDFCMSNLSIQLEVKDSSGALVGHSGGFGFQDCIFHDAAVAFNTALAPPPRTGRPQTAEIDIDLTKPFTLNAVELKARELAQLNLLDANSWVAGEVKLNKQPRPSEKAVGRLVYYCNLVSMQRLKALFSLDGLSGFFTSFHKPKRTLMALEGPVELLKVVSEGILYGGDSAVEKGTVLFHPLCTWEERLYPENWLKQIYVRKRTRVDRLEELMQSNSIWHTRDAFPTTADLDYIESYMGEPDSLNAKKRKPPSVGSSNSNKDAAADSSEDEKPVKPRLYNFEPLSKFEPCTRDFGADFHARLRSNRNEAGFNVAGGTFLKRMKAGEKLMPVSKASTVPDDDLIPAPWLHSFAAGGFTAPSKVYHCTKNFQRYFKTSSNRPKAKLDTSSRMGDPNLWKTS